MKAKRNLGYSNNDLETEASEGDQKAKNAQSHSFMFQDYDEDELPDFSKDDLENIPFPKDSEETWRLLRHLVLTEARGRTRATCLKTLVDNDLVTVWSTGARKTPNVVPLSTESLNKLAALIRSQGRARMSLIAQLIDEEMDEIGIRAEAHFMTLENLFGDNVHPFEAAQELLARKTLCDNQKVVDRCARVINRTNQRKVTDQTIIDYCVDLTVGKGKKKPVSKGLMQKKNAAQWKAENKPAPIPINTNAPKIQMGPIPLLSLPFVCPPDQTQRDNTDWQTRKARNNKTKSFCGQTQARRPGAPQVRFSVYNTNTRPARGQSSQAQQQQQRAPQQQQQMRAPTPRQATATATITHPMNQQPLATNANRAYPPLPQNAWHQQQSAQATSMICSPQEVAMLLAVRQHNMPPQHY